MSHHLLDDEALSAHLDGEGDAATAEHLASCAICEARLGELRAAAQTVGAAVAPPSDAARNAAVEAAVAAASGAEVKPTRPRIPAWVAAAAVIVLLLAAVPIVLATRDSSDEVAQRTANDAFGGSAEGAVAAPAEDIGAQSDPQALARLLDERMRTPRAPVPGGVAAAQSGSDDGRESAAEDSGASLTQGAATGAPVGPPCLNEARAAGANRVGALLYTALLEWRASPAVVHVFQAPDPKATTLTRRAFVLARSDCQLLVAPSF